MAKSTETNHEVAIKAVPYNTRRRAYRIAENAYDSAGFAWIKSRTESSGITSFMIQEVVDALIADGWRKE